MKKYLLYFVIPLLIIQLNVYSKENPIEKLTAITPQEVIIKNIGDKVVFKARNVFLTGYQKGFWSLTNTNIANISNTEDCQVSKQDIWKNNVIVPVPCVYIEAKHEGETFITFRIFGKDNNIIKGQAKIIIKTEKIKGSLYKLKNNTVDSYQKIPAEERFFVNFDKSKAINKIVFKLSKNLPLKTKFNLLFFNEPKGGYSDLFNEEDISKLKCNKTEKTCEINFFNKRYNSINIEFLGLSFNEKFLENIEIYGYD